LLAFIGVFEGGISGYEMEAALANVLSMFIANFWMTFFGGLRRVNVSWNGNLQLLRINNCPTKNPVGQCHQLRTQCCELREPPPLSISDVGAAGAGKSKVSYVLAVIRIEA
jgi:hypothetical protein